jgi:hypothetical protein
VTTRIYGCSDDLIEFDGDISGEVGSYGTDDDEKGVLLIFSDGTLLEAKYGKNGEAIWEIKAVKGGALLDRIDQCTDADADPYSDVAYFRSGLTWAFAAKGNWERVK